jgi:hypothetical protein
LSGELRPARRSSHGAPLLRTGRTSYAAAEREACDGGG